MTNTPPRAAINQGTGYVAMALDALVRAVAVNAGRPICLFLGAGASVTSGVPSAARCIWEWKREIFVTNNPALSDSVGELSLPGTKRRLQAWLDQRPGYPAENSPHEYSFYAAECYPTPQDRRSFFQRLVGGATPHVGYQLLPLLAKAGLAKTIWTTNFDSLTARACALHGVPCIEVGIDSASRASRHHSAGELRVISMHGDYRYDELKNTADELQQQEAELRAALVSEAQEYDVLVIGYSGRDESIMATLLEAFARRSAGRVFWCGYGDSPTMEVARFLTDVTAAGGQAFYVATYGFDDLITRLALRQLGSESLATAKKLLAAESETERPLAFSVPPLPSTALIKSNAYAIEYPRQALKFDLNFHAEENRRDWMEEIFGQRDGVIVTTDSGGLALAVQRDVESAFDAFLLGAPITFNFSQEEVGKDRRLQSLLRRGLIKSAAIQFGLQTDSRRRIWQNQSFDQRKHDGANYLLHRALSVRTLFIENAFHAVLMPEVVVRGADGSVPDEEIAKVIRGAVYGYQHNNKFNEDLRFWTEKIGGVPIECRGGGQFVLSKKPVFAGLVEKGKRPLAEPLQRHGTQSGLVIQDAQLVFSTRDGRKEVTHANPLKGLIENRPWDYSLTSSGLAPTVEVAVICASRDASAVQRLLSRFGEKAQPNSTEKDYLFDYPGFSMAFGIPLNLPTLGESCWQVLDEPTQSDVALASKEQAQRICRGLDAIRAMKPGAVSLILYPARWSALKVVQSSDEKFNLHDHVKAYAARHGQSTQFVREETIAGPQKCRVMWWLSLALYVKALRTPWRFNALDDDTAFVGVGYSLDLDAAPGNHVLLGCSHIYSARGEGLQFRLGRLENPIIRGRNPYMSEDDARRTGETIRQLFYEARMRLPSRVVIHKRTRFTDDEQRGLLSGLEGVQNIELIEVNIEESLRYLWSRASESGIEIDTFPVPRGGLVVQNANTALLWVHGSTPNAQNPKWRYYQGKRRIPTPLLVRRYRGRSDIVQVATEILGLSKMNWNTFDYYSRLPATLDSASAIAKIGPYLTGFTAAPYDYRLLI